jgi:DNA-binding winged helix-turn-helix (wHTH) protein/WD40 repeat protein
MSLLVLLAEHAGALVTRQQIIDAVWQQEFIGDEAVSGTIAKLRRALGDDARTPRYIETIPTRGYRLLLRPIDVLDVVGRPGGAFRVGDWLVEPSLNRMSKGGATVELDRSTMDVLLCLAERAGHPVPQHELVERVWKTESVSDFTVRRRVQELREAFGESASSPDYIEAVPDRGFRLAVAVAPAQLTASVTPFPGARDADEDREPYPGLAAFTEADAGLFFGREAETAAMWRRIAGHRLLAVVGPSGVGKSSFLRAGVIPAAPPSWGTLVCTPGEAPLTGLARALVPELAGDADQVEKLLSFDDPEVALAVVSRWRRRFEDALLVVDQLEELFTLNPAETRARFVELLYRLATQADLHVVLAIRDDFLCECHALPLLAPIFKELTVLGPPAAHHLRRALVEPALHRGFRFEDEALPDEMVAAVADERGALPLLAFAARRLWELRDRNRRLLTRDAYRQIGGVVGAVAQHAEATLVAIGELRLPLVRELFRNLVTAQGTRAVRSFEDLLSVFSPGQRNVASQVLQELIAARLLISYELSDGDGKTAGRVEIVHESLLREWPRLVGWQTQDADTARLRDQLRQAAQLWQERGRPAELLWTGAPYLEFRAWRASYPGGLSSSEEDFASAMAAHAGRRRRRRRAVAAAVLLAAVVVAAVTTVLWRRSEDRSLRLEERRLVETARAKMSQSPPEAFAYALAALELKDSAEARALALEALWASPMPQVIEGQEPGLSDAMTGAAFSPDGQRLAVGQFDGHIALWPESGGLPVVWQPHTSRSRGYFVPDGKALVSISAAEPQLVVWSLPQLERLGSFEGSWRIQTEINGRQANIMGRLGRMVADQSAPGGWRVDQRALALLQRLASDRLPAAALSPDGLKMTVALGDELFLVSVADPHATPALIGRAPSGVDFMAWSPRGDSLATAQVDGTTRLWSLEGGVAAALREWPRLRDSSYNDLLFDPAGKLLAAAFDDGTAAVRALDEPPGSDPLVLSARGSRLIQLAFHPEGSWLATAGLGRTCLWPLDRARRPLVLRGHTGGVERVAFAPDGTWLGSFGTDGTVRRWPLAAGAGAEVTILYDWGHPVEWFVGSIAMAPNGRFLVTTGGEHSARLVPLDGSAPRSLGGFDQRVLRAAVDPHSRLVAAPGYVGGKPVVRVWDLPSGAVTDISFDEPPEDPIRFQLLGIELTSDGRLLAADGRRLVAVDLANTRRETLAEGVADFAVARQGRLILGRPNVHDQERVATIHDLDAGTAAPLTSHGTGVFAVALDPSGTAAVTGSDDGVLRVGPVSGGAPYWLVGHRGRVMTVAVSPDGRWIASGGVDGTIRLWPMPDLAKTPLNALPHPELLACLRALTNLRVVPDPDNPENSVVRAGPFPGWETTPGW